MLASVGLERAPLPLFSARLTHDPRLGESRIARPRQVRHHSRKESARTDPAERMPSMHVGLATGFAHQRGKTYDDARFVREEIENLVLAEQLGFDSVWITEHHFSDYSMSNDPVQLLTYIAARTRHVKLGTQCIIAPWHHPVRLAERIVNLDILSNGRAILGFGGGLAQHEFAGLGIDMNQSRQMYNDLLEVLIPALETGVIEGKGI